MFMLRHCEIVVIAVILVAWEDFYLQALCYSLNVTSVGLNEESSVTLLK